MKKKLKSNRLSNAAACLMVEPCAGSGAFLTRIADTIYITPKTILDYIEANTP